MKVKLRLKREGEDSLKSFLRARFILTEFAEKVGTSNQTLHAVLNGERQRPNPELLRSIAERASLKLGHDEEGPYFYVEEDIQMPAEEELGKELLRIYQTLPEEARKQLDDLAKFLESYQKKHS